VLDSHAIVTEKPRFHLLTLTHSIFRYNRDETRLVHSQSSMNIMYGKLKLRFVTCLANNGVRGALKYSSTLSITSPLHGGGGWAVSATPWPLYPRNPVPI